MAKVMILVASVREGRTGLPVAKWVERELSSRDVEVDFADLKEINLPFMDEPNHPAAQQYTKEHTKAWAKRVAETDAFIWVTPEYNHSFTAPLKNAIDYLVHEWRDKSVAFVSYGGQSSGTRGVAGLGETVGFLGMPRTRANVEIAHPWGQFTDEGEFEGTEAMNKSLSATVEEIVEAATAFAAKEQ
ncbi:MAG TPA: NAD(P)H-dependent oxidoreductase [Candidatus Agrococcus pullicola]|uniref:NAD(P)H-dependent oxidoreductase n=1 Tax=Candidatus Agrococcus pullicola TaxID=2838429 RepID=A0A9D1YV15_9MICO|nr:NAD(P)H-dependent oxidoreductase [Candidatus Agrococcus pullicola]